MPRRLIVLLCCLAGMVGAQVPEHVQLPKVLYDVDWNDQEVGRTPQRASKAQLEAAGQDPWRWPTWRTYGSLDFITRTRTATVVESALGLNDQPLLFTVTESGQPHWGPRLFFGLPHETRYAGKRYRVSLDMSIDNVTKMGGISLIEVGQLLFHEDGTLRVNGVEIAKYRPRTPLHVELVIDVPTRRLTARIDDGEPVTVPWTRPDANRFPGLRLDGLLPGGHARGPGQLAFDNIKIILEE